MKIARLAIVGCGRAAERLHLPAILNSRCARLVAAVDVRSDRSAVMAAGNSGCRAFSGVEDMLAACRIDGAIVATSIEDHLRAAEPILRAPIPVLLEKPLAASAPEAARFVARSASWGAWAMMAYNRRHWPAAMQLRDMLRSRSTGPQVQAELNLCTDRTHWNPLSDRADPLDDLGSHQLDLVRFLFDEPVASISAERVHPEQFVMRARMRNGAVATCTAGFGADFVDRVSIRFAEHRLTIHAGSKYVLQEASDGSVRTLATMRQRVMGAIRGHPSSYQLQLEAFCAAIATRRPATPDLVDGLATVYATDAARRSMESNGTMIDVEQT